MTDFVTAVDEGTVEDVHRIILGGFDVNAGLEGSLSGILPLLYAVTVGTADKVELLLRHGANVDAQRDKSTALHFASSGSIAQVLLSGGATVDALDKHGHTPLLMAAYSRNEDVARVLLQNGANINGTPGGYEPFTALHVVCYQGYENMVRLFLENGADITSAMPLQISIARGHDAVTLLLLEAHARKLFKVDNLPPGIWAHVLGRVNQNASPWSVMYSLLREKPDLLNNFTNSGKRKRHD